MSCLKLRVKKALPVVGAVTGVVVPMSSFASGNATSTAVTGALTTIATDITATLGAVAPIALGIAGLFLAWKYGMRFFKSLTK